MNVCLFTDRFLCFDIRGFGYSLAVRNSIINPLSFLYIYYQVSMLYEGCAVVANTSPDFNRNCSVGKFPVLLTPPSNTCSVCSRLLTLHNKPCDVAVYSLCGKTKGLKFSLRCECCKINYNYDRYGNKSTGWCLYKTSRPLVEATDVCFLDRILLEFQCTLA